MNIAFDATAILGQMSRNRGIGNYSYSQFKHMIEMDPENTYYFFNVFEEFYMADIVGQGSVADTCFFTGRNLELALDEEYADIFGDMIRHFIEQNQIDIFYITSPFDGHIMCYRKEWFAGVRVIATVYDIIPYVMKDQYLSDKASYQFYMRRVEMLRWADEYLVISGSVKNDMVSYLNFPEEKIHVIYGAADPKVYRQIDLTEQETKQFFQKFQIQGPYIMCTGGDDARKNIQRLILAYAGLRQELVRSYQLVVVCRLSAASMEKYQSLVQKLNLQGRVIFTGFVSDSDLILLYNQAALMAFPSLYEGFGLPVIEAWMCGTAVLTSHNSSLGEIGRGAAVLVDPEHEASITKGLEDALTKADLNTLLQNGKKKLEIYNWKAVSEAALAVIHSMKKSEHPKQKEVKTIAIFTPLPPVRSGISDYSVDIISQLTAAFVIDIYIDKYKADFQENEKIHIYPAKEFGKRHHRYDRILYQVGNSTCHIYMFPFIKKYPGIVVLHDYNLRNVLESMHLYQADNPQKFKQDFMEDYDRQSADRYIERLNTSYVSRFELNGFVVNYAEKIIVHNQYAKKKLLEKNIGRKVQVIPLYGKTDGEPSGEWAEEKRKKLGIARDCLVFASFGFLHETKRNLQALKAFSYICKEYPDVSMRYFFVGEADKAQAGRLMDQITELGIRDRVTVTGYVPMDVFHAYLDIADICINLRYPYQGESSASLMRALAKGRCVIINRIGSFCEIPEQACIKIDNVADMHAGEEIRQIYEAMKMAMDKSRRETIQMEARKYASACLDLAQAGRQYIRAIRETDEKRGLNEEKLKSFAQKYLSNYAEAEIEKLAKAFAYSMKSSS